MIIASGVISQPLHRAAQIGERRPEISVKAVGLFVPRGGDEDSAAAVAGELHVADALERDHIGGRHRRLGALLGE